MFGLLYTQERRQLSGQEGEWPDLFDRENMPDFFFFLQNLSTSDVITYVYVSLCDGREPALWETTGGKLTQVSRVTSL